MTKRKRKLQKEGNHDEYKDEEEKDIKVEELMKWVGKKKVYKMMTMRNR